MFMFAWQLALHIPVRSISRSVQGCIWWSFAVCTCNHCRWMFTLVTLGETPFAYVKLTIDAYMEVSTSRSSLHKLRSSISCSWSYSVLEDLLPRFFILLQHLCYSSVYASSTGRIVECCDCVVDVCNVWSALARRRVFRCALAPLMDCLP
jgi:hypothetical protein